MATGWGGEDLKTLRYMGSVQAQCQLLFPITTHFYPHLLLPRPKPYIGRP